MTEQRTSNLDSNILGEKSKPNNRVKKLGYIGTAGAALALAFGAGGMINGSRPTEAGSNEPTKAPAAELFDASATAIPSGSPEASPTVETEIQYIEVEALTPFEVQVGDFISADVSMSDTKDGELFPLMDTDWDYVDSDNPVDVTSTALGVDVEAPGWVVGPYGKITIIRGMSADQRAKFIANETTLKTRAGFKEYKVVIWNGLEDTVNQAGNKFDGTHVGTDSTGSIDNMDNLSTQEKLNVVIKFMMDNNIDVDSADAQALIALLANCLCGCGPTESPAPSEPPSNEVCPPGKGYEDHIYNPKNGTFTTPATNGLVVRGDATINGHVYHDTLAETQALDWIWTESPKTYKISGPNAVDVLWTTCPSKDVWVEQVNVAKQQADEDGRKMDKKVIQKGL